MHTSFRKNSIRPNLSGSPLSSERTRVPLPVLWGSDWWRRSAALRRVSPSPTRRPVGLGFSCSVMRLLYSNGSHQSLWRQPSTVVQIKAMFVSSERQPAHALKRCFIFLLVFSHQSVFCFYSCVMSGVMKYFAFPLARFIARAKLSFLHNAHALNLEAMSWPLQAPVLLTNRFSTFKVIHSTVGLFRSV